MFNNKIKGISSFVAAILIHLIIGNLFTFSNLLPYYRSYLYYKNNETEVVDMTALYFVAPFSTFSLNIAIIFSGFLDLKVGVKVMTILCTILLIGSQLIFYFFIDFYLIIISYIIFGISGSFTYFQVIRNCWKYFPGKEGIISGVILSAFGLSTFIFTSIGDYIINKDGIEADKKTKFYPKVVADKYINYIFFYLICVIVMGFLSSLLCFTYKEEKIGNEEKENEQNERDIDDKENLVKKEEKKLDVLETKLTLKESILSADFFKCLTMASCTLIFGFLLTNTYRSFGVAKQLDDYGLQWLSKAFTILNTCGRIGWGLIFDKYGFTVPYFFVCINQLIWGIIIYFSSVHIVTYFIVVCFGVLSLAGHAILFPNLMKIKFGNDNIVILLGITGIFSGSACLMGPVLTLSFLGDSNVDLVRYLLVYLTGVAPTIISLILIFFIEAKYMKKTNRDNSDNKKIAVNTVSYEEGENSMKE